MAATAALRASWRWRFSSIRSRSRSAISTIVVVVVVVWHIIEKQDYFQLDFIFTCIPIFDSLGHMKIGYLF